MYCSRPAEDYVLPSRRTRRVTALVVHLSLLISNMEKDNCGYNKHETFDELMDFYKEVASDYDQVTIAFLL